jgi:hypothetical protein
LLRKIDINALWDELQAKAKSSTSSAMKKKYEVFLPDLACRNDLNRVIQWMCSELAVGHHRVGGGDAFSGALIYGMLAGLTLKETVEFAAAASLKPSITFCSSNSLKSGFFIWFTMKTAVLWRSGPM